MSMRADYGASLMDGSELKVIRKGLRLSQADTGRLAGYSREAVSIWENSVEGPPRSVAVIMRVLDKRPDLLPLFLESADME